VLDACTARNERIGDKRSMASPWDGFGAHHRNDFTLGARDYVVARETEFGRLHVVRIAAELRIVQASLRESARGVRLPPNTSTCSYPIPAPASASASTGAPKCGCRFEPGYRRMSSSVCTPCTSRSETNSSIDLVECPIVRINLRLKTVAPGVITPGATFT
jgi:hypothetical protein